MTALVWIPFVSAKETPYSALESQESVEKGGGTVRGGKFVPAKFGNGFISEKQGDVIQFPTEGVLNLEAGTVEFWIKMGWDAVELMNVVGKPERFIFLTYARTADAIFLQFEGRPEQGALISAIAGMRIKSANVWYDAYSEGLDLKIGEIHHMAGTWGQDGVKLYLDGELAATNDFKGGPTLMADVFQINNGDGPTNFDFPTDCVVDEFRLSDHQKTQGELIMVAVSPKDRLAATWGMIRKAY